MDYSIISYVALGIILIIGLFIARAAFKLHEKNFPLDPEERVLHEEQGVRLSVTLNRQADLYRSIRLKITNKRMFIFFTRKSSYLHSIIYFSDDKDGDLREEFKGVVYVPKSSFRVVHDEKLHKPVLKMDRINSLGMQVEYIFDCPQISSVQKALSI